jgi:pyruvate dehydrogenase E1 component alpha subunit
MLRLRRFEEKAGMLYALGTLSVPCPLGVGQEGAIAALAASLDAGDSLLALQDRPSIELALGASPAAAFQRLLDASGDAPATSALLRLPGEDVRRLPRNEAIAAATGRNGTVVVLAGDAAELTQFLPVLDARVLPVMVIPSDRRPADYDLPAGWTLRECDGSSAAGVREALMSARKDRHIAVSILTPPYAGHARDGSRRPQERRVSEDPIVRLRRHLIGEGRLREADAAELEAAVRHEIAAAARGVSVACAP